MGQVAVEPKLAEEDANRAKKREIWGFYLGGEAEPEQEEGRKRGDGLMIPSLT